MANEKQTPPKQDQAADLAAGDSRKAIIARRYAARHLAGRR